MFFFFLLYSSICWFSYNLYWIHYLIEEDSLVLLQVIATFIFCTIFEKALRNTEDETSKKCFQLQFFFFLYSAFKLVGSLELVAISDRLASSSYSSIQVELNQLPMGVFLGVIPILWSCSRERSKHSIQVKFYHFGMSSSSRWGFLQIFNLSRSSKPNWIQHHNCLNGFLGLLLTLLHCTGSLSLSWSRILSLS